MENQINVGDQNTQRTGQNPINQNAQVPEKPKIKYLIISLTIVASLALFGYGIYYFGKQSSKTTTQLTQDQPAPLPPTAEDDLTASWKTYNYIDGSLEFKYPEDWQAKKEEVFGSRTVTEFKYNSTPLFELTVQGNYNQAAGQPYKNLDEFLGLRLSKSQEILVDGHAAKRVADQGDPGHVIPYEEVIVFTPDKKAIVSLYYKSSYYTKPNADKVLDQILSTFKSLNKPVLGSITPTSNLKTYKTPNFSIAFPANWKVSTRQIEYYDFPTLELTKTGGVKIAGEYELPQVWIGSFEIYSTSGAICANEPYSCEKVEKISFTIKGKKYSTDVLKKQIWDTSGKITGYFFIFQIGTQSQLDSIPSKPTITGQFSTPTEKAEIENILSSINY